MHGGATVTLCLKKFTNTDNRLWNGGYCEYWSGYICDNIFQLCVKTYPPMPTSASNSGCLYYKLTDDFEGTTIDFEQTATGIDKNIVLNFDTYKVRYFI